MAKARALTDPKYKQELDEIINQKTRQLQQRDPNQAARVVLDATEELARRILAREKQT